MKRTDAPGSTIDNKFTGGNPGMGIPPTLLDASFMNVLQEEMCYVIEEAGLTLDQTGADTTQLYQALSAIIANNLFSIDAGRIPYGGGIGSPLTSSANLKYESGILRVGGSTTNGIIAGFKASNTAGYQLEIEQASTGDAALHFLLTGVADYTMGIDNSDGDKLKIAVGGALGTNDAIVIDGTGRVAHLNQPCFYGYRNAGNVAATTDFIHNVAIINRGSHYNTTNGVFTAPVAGDYEYGNCNEAPGSTIEFYKNGVSYDIMRCGDGDDNLTGARTGIVTLAVGDTVKWRVTAGSNFLATGLINNSAFIRLL